jgi:hypothetical protein
MFLFKQTNRKRVRISGYELWEIDNDGLIAESVRRQDFEDITGRQTPTLI